MSDEPKGTKPPKKQPQKKIGEVIETVRSYAPDSEKERTYEAFMASQFVEWGPFAESMGWNPNASRLRYPVSTWVLEKKKKVAQENSDDLADKIFNYRWRYHKDVLRTLKDYPETNDAIHNLIRMKVNATLKKVKDSPAHLDKIKPGELVQLAYAMKMIQESKHKSLLLHDWNVQAAERIVEPDDESAAHAHDSDREWTVHITGGENIKGSDIQSMLKNYYDPPQLPQDLSVNEDLLALGSSEDEDDAES